MIEQLVFQNKVLENGMKVGDLVGYGVDSQVFKSYDGKLAVKFYVHGSWLSDLKAAMLILDFYRRITNRASRLVKNTQDNWKIKTYEGVDVSLEVNPFIKMFVSQKNKCVVGISKFIEGSTLDGFNRSPYFNVPLYSTLWGEMDNLSRKLNYDLKTDGVSITQSNLKITSTEGNYKVVITDLCASISSLRRVKNGKI